MASQSLSSAFAEAPFSEEDSPLCTDGTYSEFKHPVLPHPKLGPSILQVHLVTLIALWLKLTLSATVGYTPCQISLYLGTFVAPSSL